MNMSVQRNTTISSRNAFFLWHARVAKKNNVAFYKIVSASSKGKQHPSLEGIFLKEQTLLRQHFFLYSKMLLKQSTFEE